MRGNWIVGTKTRWRDTRGDSPGVRSRGNVSRNQIQIDTGCRNGFIGVQSRHVTSGSFLNHLRHNGAESARLMNCEMPLLSTRSTFLSYRRDPRKALSTNIPERSVVRVRQSLQHHVTRWRSIWRIKRRLVRWNQNVTKKLGLSVCSFGVHATLSWWAHRRLPESIKLTRSKERLNSLFKYQVLSTHPAGWNRCSASRHLLAMSRFHRSPA